MKRPIKSAKTGKFIQVLQSNLIKATTTKSSQLEGEMAINQGIIALDLLINYACKDTLEALDGNSKLGRKFGKLAKATTASIPDQQGFYLWGKYETSGLWRNIYLGKAGFGKTAHLRARILEELKDERQFLWLPVLEKDKILSEGAKIYHKMWETYKNHWNRALEKAGTSHIVWVAVPELAVSIVPDIEKDLIETLNPTANRIRIAPPSSPQPFTKYIISLFREQIHLARVSSR